MCSTRYVLFSVTCLLLVIRSESWFWDDIKKPVCEAAFGVVCPSVLFAGAGAITVGSGGAAVVGAYGAASAGSASCYVAKKEFCKRNLDANTVVLPFSDNFDDYDKNGDGFITFKEFLEAVMSTVNISDPEDLILPFSDSDTNGDKQLDKKEFANSDFLFPDEV